MSQVRSKQIDILENHLRERGRLLDILLYDQTTKKNILWGTDSYDDYGRNYAAEKQIKPEQITGEYGLLIQPRAAKSKEEQRRRTKEKGEVFTPLGIIKKMNGQLDEASGFKKITEKNWQEFVKATRLEITCGEAPFIVTRYNPTAETGRLIILANRVGFLDRKLRVVSDFCDTKNKWLYWARVAFKASYGYEWQGDNLLLARENLLYTLEDYYQDKFSKKLSLKTLESFAEIISWNIFQMDGLRGVIPLSCRHETKIIIGDLTLFGKEPDVIEKNECEGCKYSRLKKHNGKYVKIMDWEEEKVVRFVDVGK